MIDKHDEFCINKTTSCGGGSSESARKLQNSRVENGTHPWLGREDECRERELAKLEAGTHPSQRNDWVDNMKNINRKLIESGKHNFLGKRMWMNSSSTPNHYVVYSRLDAMHEYWKSAQKGGDILKRWYENTYGDSNVSRNTFMRIVSMFRENYIPTEDPEWVSEFG
ncbi:TPA: hypothetical protein ACPJ2M_002689 [Vibrio alginolyticus]